MSQESVELVLGLRLARDGDFVQRVRDDDLWGSWSEAAAAGFRRDFKTTVSLLGVERTYSGMDGFRAFWLDWLAPWVSYRIEIVQAADCGDRVLVLVRDFGRRDGSTDEVTADNASVWTIDDGKIGRIDFFPSHDEALKAVGLEE
jgi:ketosteroid isomerase-like protein